MTVWELEDGGIDGCGGVFGDGSGVLLPEAIAFETARADLCERFRRSLEGVPDPVLSLAEISLGDDADDVALKSAVVGVVIARTLGDGREDDFGWDDLGSSGIGRWRDESTAVPVRGLGRGWGDT